MGSETKFRIAIVTFGMLPVVLTFMVLSGNKTRRFKLAALSRRTQRPRLGVLRRF